MSNNGIQTSKSNYYDILSFDTSRISWAGPLNSRMICFGTEDGRLIFTNEHGGKVGATFKSVSECQEAINGLASIGNCQAVSTRTEVTFLWDQFIRTKVGKSATVHAGAHGIIATPGGYFMAPMGQRGLMLVKASEQDEQNVFLINDGTNGVYFYRSIALPGSAETDVIISAVRRGGIVAGLLPHDLLSHGATTITPNNIDVVDVCSLGHGLAVAALGRDGTLMLFRDIINDKDPHNFKFKRLEGVGYRVLSARGHLFVLTSKALYLVANLASRVVSGELQDGKETQILTMPMTAVDANLFNDKYILVVNDESNVFRVDLAVLELDIPRNQIQVEPNPNRNQFNFSWNDSPFNEDLISIEYDREKLNLNLEMPVLR